MNTSIDDFVCPCCRDYALNPIFECKNGHIICQKCKPKLKSCPICRERYEGDIRNSRLELLALHFKFPCSNECYDCPVKLSPWEKQSHESTCEFIQFQCPLHQSKCSWVSRTTLMARHLIQTHQAEFYSANFATYSIKNAYSTNTPPILIEWSNKHFLITIESFISVFRALKFLIVPQIIGSQKKASKYILATSIHNNMTTKRVMMPFKSLNNVDITSNLIVDFNCDELDLSGPFHFYFCIRKIS